MRVRLRTTLVGPAGMINAGEIADLPETVARMLVNGRYAEFETAMIEATAAPVETATKFPPPQFQHRKHERARRA